MIISEIKKRTLGYIRIYLHMPETKKSNKKNLMSDV